MPESRGQDRIRKREDWSEFADPLGMVHFRIQGPGVEGRGRMDVFWALVKELRLRETDVGGVKAEGDGFVFEVPEQAASVVSARLRESGLGGKDVDIEPIRRT